MPLRAPFGALSFFRLLPPDILHINTFPAAVFLAMFHFFALITILSQTGNGSEMWAEIADIDLFSV
ncbi:hypothetical protein AYY18_10670 [Morganella psychrotolerans]|uniref:Uncharacterized protein n=1 Tax=Morganella psychrotolerans TaxID=368603 RepID=A0A1B8H225_9GAMM|nr:hypothetical protein AYY18_10670 [Morganella psychrotolerans]